MEQKGIHDGLMIRQLSLCINYSQIDEIPEVALHRIIRVRKGKINHFNGTNSFPILHESATHIFLFIDMVSINVSDQSIIQIH